MDKNDSKGFFEALFNEGEVTCFGENKYATKTYKAIQTGIKEDNQLFTINPLKKGSTRLDENVLVYRNFLFEIDEYEPDVLGEKGEKVPKEIQGEIVFKSKLPYTTSVWSGGKSFHWIISLNNDNYIESKVEYIALWKAVASVLNKTANGIGVKPLKFDTSTKNPSRLSRCANALRLQDTGPEIQKLAKVKTRIDIDDLTNWLELNGVNWYDYMPKPATYTSSNEINLESTTEERIDFVLKYRMQNMVYESGMNTWQYTYARNLYNTGLNKSEIEAAILKQCGAIDSRLNIDAAITACKSDEKIYVWSKEDKRKWAEEQSNLEKQAVANTITDNAGDSNTIFNGEVADVNLGGVHNYIRVATKYYRADSSGIDVWDKQTIKDDFGPQIIHSPDLKKYRGFINEPNYIERIEHVTKVINAVPHAFYNKHWYPNWELTKGEFPTIMKLLEKVFIANREDKLEFGLDWIQLMFKNPKQRTRSLVLTGPPETGKDTFMEWLVYMVTFRNGIILEGAEIESNFNSHWAGKHLVCLNEVSFDVRDKTTKERIKNLLTGERVTVEGKGDQQYQVENYSKVVMATNNMHDFMAISDDENRFCILEMALLKGEDKDGDFKTKLKQETPAFLYWIIKERELWRKEKSGRFWHTDEESDTQAYRDLKKNTKSSLYDELEDLLEEKFRVPELRDKEEYSFRVKSLAERLRASLETKGLDSKYNDKAVKMCLLKEFGLRLVKTDREDAFNAFISGNQYYFTVTRENLGVVWG